MKVLSEGRIPVKSWAPKLDPGATEQSINLANLPFAMSHVALMPDAHSGFGMPIGGVLFADKAVVPYGIGVDIGCGVTLARTDLTVDKLKRDRLGRVLEKIDKSVPTGMRSHDRKVDVAEAVAEIGLEVPDSIQKPWFDRAIDQIGTLGSGNHFLEVQRDTEGRIYVMLHSGSRSLGKTICDAFHKRALALNERWYSQLPHKELAFLPVGTPEFEGYWSAMTYALRFAEVNRARMLAQAEAAFWAFTSMTSWERVVDIHHNYAAWENHKGKNGIVHRKGAVRARTGETVLIPGSMGTASFIAEGLGNPESFETCQHGAGRAMSRTKAREQSTSDQVYHDMEKLGIELLCSSPRDVAEEAAYAYKDIDEVMAASADLIRPVTRLTPLGVVKG
jgi:tRNA-splicing ligase RtcB (3'-phosphate/5'-hydroxy nucleic acid ligase)